MQKIAINFLQSTHRWPPFTLPATLPVTRIFFYYPTRSKKTLLVPACCWHKNLAIWHVPQQSHTSVSDTTRMSRTRLPWYVLSCMSCFQLILSDTVEQKQKGPKIWQKSSCQSSQQWHGGKVHFLNWPFCRNKLISCRRLKLKSAFIVFIVKIWDPQLSLVFALLEYSLNGLVF